MAARIAESSAAGIASGPQSVSVSSPAAARISATQRSVMSMRATASNTTRPDVAGLAGSMASSLRPSLTLTVAEAVVPWRSHTDGCADVSTGCSCGVSHTRTECTPGQKYCGTAMRGLHVSAVSVYPSRLPSLSQSRLCVRRHCALPSSTAGEVNRMLPAASCSV